MMSARVIRTTLLTDGSSDAVLQHHLAWLLEQHTRHALPPVWADLSRLPHPPRGLDGRIRMALDLYPCELLFVHRDAERTAHHERVAEIHQVIEGMAVPTVCVVPVRMQEAWLLFDVAAIRRAAGNPGGRMAISLPRLTDLESLPDPKSALHDLLRQASGFSGRRLKRFLPHRAARLVGQFITDFSPLRALPAFQALEDEIVTLLEHHRW